MPEDFSLYDFTKNLSLVGWVLIFALMVATIYVISKGTELLVTKKCPFCARRIPKRSFECKFCKKAVV